MSHLRNLMIQNKESMLAPHIIVQVISVNWFSKWPQRLNGLIIERNRAIKIWQQEEGKKVKSVLEWNKGGKLTKNRSWQSKFKGNDWKVRRAESSESPFVYLHVSVKSEWCSKTGGLLPWVKQIRLKTAS